MIVSFSVANFRSFAEEETFSLVASKRLSGDHPNHLIPIPDSDEHVLKTSVLYGANGAGKSNLFKALQFLKKIALETRAKNTGTGREAFRFADNMEKQSSNFDLQFIAGDKLFRFGCLVDDKKIVEEWLVQIIGGREKVIYERVTDEKGKVTIEASKEAKKMSEKFAALVTVGAPQNQSFLATIQANLENENYGDSIADPINWFNISLILMSPENIFIDSFSLLENKNGFQYFTSEFLNSSGTGIESIEAQRQEISKKELHNLLPNEPISLFIDIISKEGGLILLPINDYTDVLIEKKDEVCLSILKIVTTHKKENNKTVELDILEESDGTRRLLSLLPALHQVDDNTKTYFIDAIDRSIHPILSWYILDFFLKPLTKNKNQLIATTHESNLLDLDLLRRDEIWFSEKDPAGATHLYSLADFKVRKDLEIRKHYLQGRFGAIPFLGNLDALLEKTNESDAA